MRWTHLIKENKKCESPSRAIALAVAYTSRMNSDGFRHYSLQSGSMICARKRERSDTWTTTTHSFKTAQQAWSLIESFTADRTRTYLITSGNIRTLALIEAFTVPMQRDWEITYACLEANPIIVRYRRENSTILLYDESNLSSMRSCDIGSGRRTRASTNGNSATNVDKRVSKTQRGAAMMLRSSVVWWNFLIRENLGNFKPTLAAQAMQTYRHRFLSEPILIDNNEPALKLARASLRGGRCEAFALGKRRGTYYLLDVNSMYAACMRDLLVPVRLRFYTTHATPVELAEWDQDSVCVAHCRVHTCDNVYAVHAANELTFPRGQFDCYLAGEEVTYAIAHEHIDKVYECAVYELAYAFRKFVDHCWSKRVECVERGDTDGSTRWKTLMAAFYGKWAQHGQYWEMYDHSDDIQKVDAWSEVDADTQEVTRFRQFGGVIQSLSRNAESSSSHPAIAACITAAARLRLFDLITVANPEHVLYCDTDSLLVDQHGYDALESQIRPDALGGLRVEGVHHSVVIHGKKHYKFDARVRRCGIKSSAIKLDNRTMMQENDMQINTMTRSADLTPRSRTVRIGNV